MRWISIFKATILSIPIVFSALLISWDFLFVLGFVMMSLFNYVWWHGEYVRSKCNTGFIFLEHYHWAIMLSLLSILLDGASFSLSTILYGGSMALWVDECFYQDHPFAIGSTHEGLSDVIGFSLFIVWILTIAFKLQFAMH